MTIEITVHDVVHVTESIGDSVIRVLRRVRQSFMRACSIATPAFVPLPVERMRGPPEV